MSNIIDFFTSETSKKTQKITIIIIYILAIILFNFRVMHYQNSLDRFPDESTHIAYIAYLVKTNKIIPEYVEMKELEFKPRVEDNQFKDNSINHLGHPPLYYHIMKLFNIVKVDGNNVTYSLFKLRMVSQIISSFALALAFYIGYKKLKNVLSNLVFAILFISIPLLSYISGAVNNDVLSFLGVNLFILGMLRLTEKNRNYLTYFIIAIATFICMLNKLTVGLVIVIAYIIIMLYTIIKEKSFKVLLCRQFFVTFPIYLIILIYYLIIIGRYGTVNPSLLKIAPEYLKTTVWYNSRVDKNAYTLKMYAPTWWLNFKKTWAGINEKTHRMTKDKIHVKSAMLIFIFPLVYYIIQKIKKEKINITYYSIYISTIIAIIMQFLNAWYEFKNYTGYWGKYHGRYHVCAMLPFVYAFAKIIEEIINKTKIIKYKNIATILTIVVFIGYIVFLY